MTIPETGDAVTFSQEADGVRARAGTISYLFPAADQPAVVAAYATIAAQARDHFGSRLRSFGESVGEKLTDEVARRVALDQAWLSYVNRRLIDPRPRPWGQIVPVRRIVADVVARALPRRRVKAAVLTAHLFDLSPDAYAAWQEGDRREQDR